MILKSLTLHNFMSYADARVDLSGVAVACLSGHNGAGKSALLDAITWALWEEARSGSDELIRLGEKEMWVDLVFDYERRTYRVRRSRLKRSSKGGQRVASKGALELQVLASLSKDERENPAPVAVATRHHQDGQDVHASQSRVSISSITWHPAIEEEESQPFGHWRSLTGANMRATQQAICELLRMDYDTFINSAYLRQGAADEFTTRLPSERKQILAEILGLTYFDRLQEACRLRARDSKTKIEMIEGSLLSLPDLQDERTTVESELAIQKEELHTVEETLKKLDYNVVSVSTSIHELRLMQQRLQHCVSHLDELNGDVERLTRQKYDLEKRQGELSTLIEKSGEIKLKAQEFEAAKAEIEALDQNALASQTLTEEKLQLQSQLANIRSRLEVELDHIKQSAETIKKRAESLRIDTRDGDKIRTAYAEFKKLLSEETEQALKQDAFTRLSERAVELQSMVAEAKIKLEAELGQKELMLVDLDEVVTAESLLSQQKQDLEESVRELERVESEFELVEDKGLLLKSEIEGLEVKVEEIRRRQLDCRDKIRELTEHKHESICPLCSAPIVDRLAVIERYKDDIRALEAEVERLQKTREDLDEERNDLRMRYLKLRRDLERRKELDKRIGQFNEKEETIQRARESRARVARDIQSLEQRLLEKDFAQVERESLINVKAEIHKLEFDPMLYSNLQSQIRAKRHVESRYMQLKRDLVELEKVERELPIALEKQARSTEELETESYGQEIRDNLKVIKDKLSDLKYDRERHQTLKTELVALIPYVEQVRDLKKAMDELPVVEESLAEVNGVLDTKTARIPEVETEIDTLRKALLDLTTQEYELADLQEQLDVVRNRFNELSKQVAITGSRKEQIDRDLDQLTEKKNQLALLTEEREDHLFLAESFGKKGIQAVIIENAIPEIESEANRILARLSDNKMHVALVTQQKNKSGTVAETLDILIGDEIGTRNYELYSGGEAFKVNFAIRIALSRLLSRRAGARLETLIIDEGFGSQDDQSRDRLVRAIKSIQTDFKKILVITHISDVREMFPVQIQVQKEAGVSRLQVVC